jgi:hypothetical protein
VIAAANERVWLEAQINGKAAQLCFDTGANFNALSPRALKKFGLKFVPADTSQVPAPTDLVPGVFRPGDTEECTLYIEGLQGRTTFLVFDGPMSHSDFDGLIGWYSLSQTILRIDGSAHKVVLLPDLPNAVIQWSRFQAATNMGVLDLKIPDPGGKDRVLCIDTGSDNGFALPASRWLGWKQEHPQRPMTLETFFSPIDGFCIEEQSWADEISVGSLLITDLPVSSSGPGNASRLGSQYEGTLGLAAIKRLEMIVDGKRNTIYLRARKGRSPPYSYNRLGAAFGPTLTHTNQGVARVIQGSPAYEAGVRDGDVLLQVDDVVVKTWSADWANRFSKPAGTKLTLTLEREGRTFKTTATLRDILHPSSSSKK